VDLRHFVRSVPDFPVPGILFRDITPLLADPGALARSIDALHELVDDFSINARIDKVVGIESRGFLFGVPLALRLGAGFVPLRKPGKLPWNKRARSYALEYGEATLELHADAIAMGERVLIVDDLLATGGTALAGAELVEESGGSVAGLAFVVELVGLDGRARLGDRPVRSLLPLPVGGED
jgi:adenine phosphoribosyltransferase